MPPAPYHKDHEAIRETLYSLNILDTPLEERFQRITRMVCAALSVPISAFSIIDGERQWFKSIQGLDATENTRAESFCAYTILGNDIMVVPDANKDVRFSANPLVKGDPHISFYAGCPIRAPDGRNIGSLCAIDTKVRDLTPDQLVVLRDLATMLESELKAAHLSKTQYDLIHDLNAAQRQLLIDPATRLWNRNGLEDILRRECAKASDKKSAVSLALFEIKNISNITLKYSRSVSEALVKEVSKRLFSLFKGQDSLGRLDGDRFLAIIPGFAPEKIKSDIEKICRDATAKSFTVEGYDISLTLDFGVTADIANLEFNFDNFVNLAEAELRIGCFFT